MTDTPAIDTSQSYAPEGSKVCFESDRGGKPQIYVMRAGGGGGSASVRRGSYSDAGVVARGTISSFTKKGRRAVRDRHHEDRRIPASRIITGLSTMKGRTFAPTGRVEFFCEAGGGAGQSRSPYGH